jgi:capsular exopolysaccharide synthesis family protein
MMSEFFKALEQAERDRLRSEGAADATPTAQPNATGNGTGAATVMDRAATAAETTAEAPRAATAAETTADAFRPTAPPPPPTVPPAMPPRDPAISSAYPPITPGNVFRPSLEARDGVHSRRRRGRRPPPLIAHTDPSSIEAEAYRTVRAKIELMSHERACRYIAITSVAGGDGKSTSAANLAVVAAQGGRRVCLVDADLRHPTLHEIFGLSNVDGLAFALAHGKPLQALARPTDIDNLSVVVAGRSAQQTFEDLLTQPRLERMVADSESAFDLVVFDTGPVMSVADTLNVVAACDGVILVVRSGSLPFSVLRRALQHIEDVKGRLLGVLLNRVHLRGADSDYYRYHRPHRASKA